MATPRFEAPLTPPPPTSDVDVVRARAVIAAMRDCNLVLAPWRGLKNEPTILVLDGPDDRGGGIYHFMDRPECRLKRDLPRGLIHRLLCEELDLDPGDPYLCERVNAMHREPEQVAS